MTKKTTKREMFTAIKATLTNPEYIAFIDHEIELLDKKNSREKKPTATQIANEGIKKVIFNTLSDVPMTVSELQKANEELANCSNQKISALLKQMIEIDHSVAKVVDKRKSYFVRG